MNTKQLLTIVGLFIVFKLCAAAPDGEKVEVQYTMPAGTRHLKDLTPYLMQRQMSITLRVGESDTTLPNCTGVHLAEKE